MSAEVARYECRCCRARFEARRPRLTRRLESRDVIVDATYGWCVRCDAIRPVESIPSAEAFEADAEFVEQALAEGDADALEYIRSAEDSRTLAAWRRERKSPPRCLVCASPDTFIAEIPSSGGPGRFPHPGCEGNLEIVNLGFIPDVAEIVIDAEGLPLGVSKG